MRCPRCEDVCEPVGSYPVGPDGETETAYVCPWCRRVYTEDLEVSLYE